MNPVGIDVAAKEFVAEILRHGRVEQATFTNDASGHRKAIKWMTRRGQGARVCLEATGVYSLALALALHRAKAVDVMVANPKATRKFAEARMVRAKTDAVDAHIIREYLCAMAFVAWVPPCPQVLELQGVTRRIGQLKKERTRERNRLHAAQAEGPTAKLVARDIGLHITQLERRIERLTDSGLALIHADEHMRETLEIIVSTPGIANTSALQLMGELLTLSSDMRAPQWVAYAGIDPRPVESGTSIKKLRRISKQGNVHLRAALYMPALVAAHHDPHVMAFYNKLVEQGKAPLQALVAVMRKLLHALWGMLHSRTPWDGEKFYRLT